MAGFGGSLRIAAPAGPIRKVLDVTGLTDLLDVFDSIEDACASG